MAAQLSRSDLRTTTQRPYSACTNGITSALSRGRRKTSVLPDRTAAVGRSSRHLWTFRGHQQDICSYADVAARHGFAGLCAAASCHVLRCRPSGVPRARCAALHNGPLHASVLSGRQSGWHADDVLGRQFAPVRWARACQRHHLLVVWRASEWRVSGCTGQAAQQRRASDVHGVVLCARPQRNAQSHLPQPAVHCRQRYGDWKPKCRLRGAAAIDANGFVLCKFGRAGQQ